MNDVHSGTPYDVIGRPLLPNHRHQHQLAHPPHHLYHHQQQQQQESVGVTTDDVNTAVDRLGSLQTELETRDSVTPAQTTTSDQHQLIDRKDKVPYHQL